MEQYACPVCSNAKLSCVVNGSTDTLLRTTNSKTGCTFDFNSGGFSVDCSTQTFCFEGLGCSKYTASGSTFSVGTTLGPINCAPAKN